MGTADKVTPRKCLYSNEICISESKFLNFFIRILSKFMENVYLLALFKTISKRRVSSRSDRETPGEELNPSGVELRASEASEKPQVRNLTRARLWQDVKRRVVGYRLV